MMARALWLLALLALVLPVLCWRHGGEDDKTEKETLMNASALSSILVIALRHFWPLLGGAGVASDDELQKVAGAVILLGSVGYHAWQRHRTRKADA